MFRVWTTALVATALLGCTGDNTGDDTGPGDGGSGSDICTEPVEPSCIDDIISDLSLQDDAVSDGAVSNSADGDGWETEIDASAGGFGQETNNPWVYVKFTSEGMERVGINDEEALESMDWDLSLRRFIIRINSGDSGPSCVGAATFYENTYEDLTEIPDGVSYLEDDFYTDDCSFINDSSGLEGSPQVALGGWWSYETCVKTTGYPHLIQLADGHVVKLVVDEYYGTDQDKCNSTGAPGKDGGEFTVRWMTME